MTTAAGAVDVELPTLRRPFADVWCSTKIWASKICVSKICVSKICVSWAAASRMQRACFS